MNELLNLVLFFAGLFLLLKGAAYVTEHSASIAERFGLSQLVIGITLVAFSTSLPELAVCLTSIIFGANEIVVGTIVGSNIANIGLILGVSALVVPLVGKKEFLKEGYITMAFTLAVSLFLILGMSWPAGIFLISGLFFYICFLCRKNFGGRERSHQKAGFLERLTERDILVHLLLAFFGAGLVILGAYVLVSSTIAIASWLGVPEFILSLIAIAVGTSLPELATSFVAAVKGMRGISVGNAIGSNVFNIAILGLSATFAPVPPASGLLLFDVGIMLFITALLVFFMRTDWRISRLEGYILLLVYVAFIYLQFA